MDGAEVGKRLRAIRLQKGLSFPAVDAQSNREFTASALGSYERDERAMSVLRLFRLAEFYGVPVHELLPKRLHNLEIDVTVRVPTPPEGFTIDLIRLRNVADTDAAVVARYVATIQHQRGDFQGPVLTIRYADLGVLAAVLGRSADELAHHLDELGLRAR